MSVEELCDAALNYWVEADNFHKCLTEKYNECSSSEYDDWTECMREHPKECSSAEYENFSALDDGYDSCIRDIETTIEWDDTNEMRTMIGFQTQIDKWGGAICSV